MVSPVLPTRTRPAICALAVATRATWCGHAPTVSSGIEVDCCRPLTFFIAVGPGDGDAYATATLTNLSSSGVDTTAVDRHVLCRIQLSPFTDPHKRVIYM